jgi:NAD(P)-dependent dehydrogenase (short-subunit alcohol dehydrogenase family)
MMQHFIDFEQKVIVLSGATSGIGRAIAAMLDQCNARLLLLGRNEAALATMARELPHQGHQYLCVDLEKIDSLDSVLKPVLQDIGKIYGFCHCAGVVFTRSLHMTKQDIVQKQLLVNVTAAIELARLVTSKGLTDIDGGSLLFISSIYSHAGAPGQIGYCTSKGAINAAVRAMAVELAPRKIRVNSLSPGFVRTEMTTKKAMLSEEQMQSIIDRHPLGEGKPADIARAAAFLLAPQNPWITGTDLIIDGGYTAQ